MGMTIDECFKWLEYHKQGEVGKAVECIDIAIDTMRKYQKIQEVMDSRLDDDAKSNSKALSEIEVIMYGNDN